MQLSKVVFPEPVPPEMRILQRLVAATSSTWASSSVRLPKDTSLSNVSFSSLNLRMVRAGPSMESGRTMTLTLGLTRDDAVAWNRAFEEQSGTVVEDDGRVVYCGTMRSEFAKLSATLAEGFHVDDLETVCEDMVELRAKLGG